MLTRRKNKSSHPAAPVMTARQLASAGITKAQAPKKPSQAQRIAALEEELRAAQEQLQMVATAVPSLLDQPIDLFPQDRLTSTRNPPGIVSDSPGHDGNTELATDDDDDYAPVSSCKRAASKPPSGGVRFVISLSLTVRATLPLTLLVS